MSSIYDYIVNPLIKLAPNNDIVVNCSSNAATSSNHYNNVIVDEKNLNV